MKVYEYNKLQLVGGKGREEGGGKSSRSRSHISAQNIAMG